MARLLLLVHRMPYPPDKGDKVRSFHLLQHLSRLHDVHLGTFIDDPADWAHLDAVRQMCADVCVRPLRQWRARAGALLALMSGRPLSIGWYDDGPMRHWVHQTLTRHSIDAIVVFSSAMASYVMQAGGPPLLLDMVDVDSAKWARYSEERRGLAALLYRLEARRLLAFEAKAAQHACGTWLSTEPERALFMRLAPHAASRVGVYGNGVDAEYFRPDPGRDSPFSPAERAIVFTGAMDYLPNVDAATWFAQALLPRLRQRIPAARFYIVGRSPTAAVRRLQADAVSVTGTVADVRPYLQHAAVVTVPLRIARGIQNKLLEAMAMGRPVVAARECTTALGPSARDALIEASSDIEHVERIAELLADPHRAAAFGAAGRRFVETHHAWSRQFVPVDDAVQAILHRASAVDAPGSDASRRTQAR